MERIARMSRMHASSIFRCSDRRNKKTKQTKRRKNFGLARKRERNASWKRDQNLQETDINIFKLISDDD